MSISILFHLYAKLIRFRYFLTMLPNVEDKD